MAFVGPLTSVALGGVFLLASFLLGGIAAIPTLLLALLAYTGIVNLLLGVFNLIPGFPMDGGRVLRAIIWKATGSLARATQWAANIGQAIAYLMILVGVWLFFTGYSLDGIWIGFIGLFLLLAAQTESAQVRLEASAAGVVVGEVMTAAPALVTPNLPVQQFVDDYLLRSGLRAALVVDDLEGRRLLGIATLRDVRQLERERWATTPIGQIMTPLAQLKTVEARQPLSDALPVIRQAGVNQLPVVSDGRLVGMLSLETIVERLQMRHELGLDTTAGARDLRPPREAERGAVDAADTRLPTPS
jgi:CBS domain-containing protein